MAIERKVLKTLLDGGYIEAYNFDMREALVTMRVDVLENEHMSSYDIRFERVSHITFETEQSWFGSDYRLQVTELYVDAVPEASASEEWQVTISIWDIARLTIRCSLILVDGEPLR